MLLNLLRSNNFQAVFKNDLRVISSTFGMVQNRQVSSKKVRIGCASGFWGDTATSTEQLVEHGNIDYLVSDYLAEITMSLLTAAKRKNPEMGFAPDFVKYAVGPMLHRINEKNVKVITNAGGTNPQACANALKSAAKKIGQDLEVAVVLGDNLLPKLKDLVAGHVRDMNSGLSLPKGVMSMNSYFGAEPIRKALDLGADMVITGRCVDSALVLAPLMHAFNWSVDDFDKLSAGSLAGHLLECGAQTTGGIFTDWKSVPDWENIGFPIAECYENGDILITKPPSTGGLVSPATVSEQLVYEIGDPAKYVLPDVVCDFTDVTVTQRGEDEVMVKGAKGLPPTDNFKVCATYIDGYRATAVFSVAGKRAIAKGRRTAESILKRIQRMFAANGLQDFSRILIHAVGDESGYGAQARQYGENNDGPRETVVWLAVEHKDKTALELFSREIAAAGTGMAPGLCNFVGGRPKASPVLKLFSFLHPKKDQDAEVVINEKTIKHKHFVPDQPTVIGSYKPLSTKEALPSGSHSFLLEDLAFTRSGDKGNHANVGVIARHPSYMPYLRKHLTSEVLVEYFNHLFEDGNAMVERYELPGINGFNFLLKDCLGGGGVSSLRMDPQGKSLGQILLDYKFENLPDIVNLVEK